MTRTLVREILLVVTGGFVFPSPSGAQTPGTSVPTGIQISSDSPKTPFAETFLAVNPRDPKNVIAASLVVANGTLLSWVYASRDGGGTWQRARTMSENNTIFKRCGWDPVVYFDADGTAFFAMISTPARLLLSRSNDGGFTWESPVTVPGGPYDRPYLAFDDTGGRFNGRMYAVAAIDIKEVNNGRTFESIELFSSSDKGRTFSPGRVLASVEGHEEVSAMPADLLVTSEGKLVIPYSTYPSPGEATSSSSGHWWTTVSEDGGLTFLPAEKGPTWTRAAAWFQLMRSDAVPRAAIDSSKGSFRDRIYLTWPDFDGKNYAVKVSHSSDLGRTWSKPIAVNDDTDGGQPSNPAIAINRDGAVAVVFNDRRNDPKNSCYSLYYSVSHDGGETFLPNVKASEKPTCPLAVGNWAPFALSSFDLALTRPWIMIRAPAERFANGGDTQGLVAGSDGVFRSVWIDGESGVMQLWSKRLALESAAAIQSPFGSPRKDLSSDLALEVSEPSIDFTTHRVSVRARLLNPFAATIQGPFTVVLDQIESSLNHVHAINCDSGLLRRGAAWNFTVRGKTSLEPQEKSDERILRWEFAGGPPDEPSGFLFRAHFIILGQPQR